MPKLVLVGSYTSKDKQRRSCASRTALLAEGIGVELHPSDGRWREKTKPKLARSANHLLRRTRLWQSARSGGTDDRVGAVGRNRLRVRQLAPARLVVSATRQPLVRPQPGGLPRHEPAAARRRSHAAQSRRLQQLRRRALGRKTPARGGAMAARGSEAGPTRRAGATEPGIGARAVAPDRREYRGLSSRVANQPSQCAGALQSGGASRIAGPKRRAGSTRRRIVIVRRSRSVPITGGHI